MARTLGVYCIENEAAINELRDRYGHTPGVSTMLERGMVSLGAAFWNDVAVGDRPIADAIRADPVANRFRRAAIEPPLFRWLLLRALCVSGLHFWFESTRDVITLQRGDPYPIAVGPPLRKHFEPTPHPDGTLSYNELLWGTGYHIHRWDAGAALVVELDYSRRTIIDEAVWGTDPLSPELPSLSSIHPYAEFENEFVIGTCSADWFFDVAPLRFDQDGLCDALVTVGRHANIVVIPELSLPRPDALSEFLHLHAASAPPLVIAGSAHQRLYENGRELRVNACEVYWEGVRLLAHHKRHPVQLKIDGVHRLPEGLTNEQKRLRVICGDRTRLAVVICADLNDTNVPPLLQAVNVNMLLVPALTPNAGAFEGTLSGLASQCQGFSMIANGSPPSENTKSKAAAEPFMIMLGIPRTDGQVKAITCGEACGRRAIGTVDLSQANVEWQPYS